MEYRLTKSNTGHIRAEDLYNYHIKHKENILNKFLTWCETQESNRFLWLAVSFFASVGLTLPLTAYCIVLFGDNNFLLWGLILAVNVPVMVLNLAALPTKTTLPFLFFGWLTQAVVIVYCIVFALM